MMGNDHSAFILAAACCIDQLWGEYPNRWHPVAWMGHCIELGRKALLGWSPRTEFVGGFLLLLVISLGFASLTAGILASLRAWPWLQTCVAIYLLKASFALRALGHAAVSLGQKLEEGDQEGARWALRSLCSRSAQDLDEEHLLEASISSLAENLSDSLVAPLFFYLLAGIPGAIFYRAVNTLDAMVGYKNHLRHLGYASARCDDLLNWLPARITSFLLLLVGGCSQYPWRHACSVAWTDHRHTPSPNGGWPMACMAGLLEIQLRKPGAYTLGKALRSSTLDQLQKAWLLTQRTGRVALGLSLFYVLERAIVS